MVTITKRRVLGECLKFYETELKRFSRNLNGLEPMDGYDKPFSDTEKKCEVIRDMMRDLDASPVAEELEDFVAVNEKALKDPAVRERIRKWQREIMEGRRPGLEELKLDGGREHAATL